MSRKAYFSARQEVQNWSVENVVEVLKKNDLAECCEAVRKRGIDGEGLLGLTEGKLALWKKEIGLSSIRKLSKLVQDLTLTPERFTLQKNTQNGNGEVSISELNNMPSVNSLQRKHAPENSIQKLAVEPSKNMPENSPSNFNDIHQTAKGILSSLNLARFNQNNSSSEEEDDGWGSDFDDVEEEQDSQFNVVTNVNGFHGKINGFSTEQKDTTKSVSKPNPPLTKPPLLSKPIINPKPVPSALYRLGPPTQLHNSNKPPVSQPPPPLVSQPSNVKKLPAPPTPEVNIRDIRLPEALNKNFAQSDDEDEQYNSVELPSREFITALINKTFSTSTESITQQNFNQIPENSTEQKKKNYENHAIVTANVNTDVTKTGNIKTIQSSPLVNTLQKSRYGVPMNNKPRELPPEPPVTVPKFKNLPPPLVNQTADQDTEEKYEIIDEVSEFVNRTTFNDGLKSKYGIPTNAKPLFPSRNVSTEPVVCTLKSKKPPPPPPVNNGLEEHDNEENYESIDGFSQNLNMCTDNNGYISEEEYESIKENAQLQRPIRPPTPPEDYLHPVHPPDKGAPPPLPSKPIVDLPPSRPPSPPRKKSDESASSSPGNSGDGVIGRIFRKNRSRSNSLQTNTNDIKERAPTPEIKKVTNLPPPPPQKPPDRPVANQRPLPPTPETNKPILDHNSVTLRKPPRPNVSHMPWFHNVDRKQAEELLKNSENGTFLLRPTTQTQNVFTLTLWYNRLYNISVRLRADGKYALGTEKPKEQAFSTVEELVTNYQSEKLVLYSGGERTGQTLLVNTPPKRELF